MWQCELYNICDRPDKTAIYHCIPHEKKSTCHRPHGCNRNSKFDGQQMCVDLDVDHLMTPEEAKQCGLI